MLALFLLFVAAVLSQRTCDNGWSEFNGYCYKHFDQPDNRQNFGNTRMKCGNLGGDLATGATKAERDFMEKLNRPTYGDKFPYFEPYNDQLLVGIYQNIFNIWSSVNDADVIERPLPWCGKSVDQAEPNAYAGKERCVIHHTYAPPHTYCYGDINCNLTYRRFICKKKKDGTNMPVRPIRDQ